MAKSGDVTLLLSRYRDGDTEAATRLMALLYGELRAAAGQLMDRERAEHTLQPTALVHEAWLRMMPSAAPTVSREAFVGCAARVMRQVLVDHARARSTEKRSTPRARVALDDSLVLFESRDLDVLALDEALQRLAERDEQLARLVEMRFFGGLSQTETGKTLGLTRRQVEHAWSLAKAFLHRELQRA